MSLIDPFPNLLPWVYTPEDSINLLFELEVESLLISMTQQAFYPPEFPVHNLTSYCTPFDPEE